MGLRGLRFFAYVSGVAEAVVEDVENSFDFDSVAWSNGVLEADKEGGWIFADEFVSLVQQHMDTTGAGKADVIDHDDWTMQRWEFTHDAVEVKEIPLNDVLERYNQE